MQGLSKQQQVGTGKLAGRMGRGSQAAGVQPACRAGAAPGTCYRPAPSCRRSRAPQWRGVAYSAWHVSLQPAEGTPTRLEAHSHAQPPKPRQPAAATHNLLCHRVLEHGVDVLLLAAHQQALKVLPLGRPGGQRGHRRHAPPPLRRAALTHPAPQLVGAGCVGCLGTAGSASAGI